MKTILRDLINKGSGAGLGARITHGAFWLGMGTGTEHVTRLVRNVVLARILAPDAFGVMAIVLASSAMFEAFTEMGIRQVIIQNPRSRGKSFLNGAWWFSATRAIVLYGIAYAATPIIAKFYGNPDLTAFLRIALLSLIFNGLMSPEAYIHLKDMNYKRWAIIQHGGGIVGILTAVALAIYIPNAWALVIGFTVEAGSRFVMSHLLCPFRPGFHFVRTELHEMLQYAKGMIGLPIMTFIALRTDIFVIGKLFPSAELGLYSMASSLAQMPFMLIIAVMTQILMPIFSEYQDDNIRINSFIFKVTIIFTVFAIPLTVFLFFYGDKILYLVYGAPYARMAMPFALIFATAMLRACSVPITIFFFSSGNPQLHRFFTAWRMVLIIGLIYPLTYLLGLTGAAMAGLIAMACAYMLQLLRLNQITRISLKQYCLTFREGLISSIPVMMVSAVANCLWPNKPVITISAGLGGCILAYGLAPMLLIRIWKSA